MSIFLIAATLYLVCASVIEAAVQTLYRFYKDLRMLSAKVNCKPIPEAKKIRSEWSVVARWMSLLLSILMVHLIDITFIVVLLKELFQMEPSPALASLDLLLTGLVISRGSNFLHDFIEKQKETLRMNRD